MIDVRKALQSVYPQFFTNYPDFFTKITVSILKAIFHEKEINNFLAANKAIGIEFVEKVMEYFNFTYKVSNKDIENIPSSGKVVMISNHPLGGLDSLSLLSMVYKIRSDVKIVANEVLMQFDPIKNLLLPVDNMNGRSAKDSLKEIVRALNNEEAVILFPAGEVSRVRPTGIKDTKWKNGFLKFAKKTNSPILPIYVNARNSWFFYFVSMLFKPAATVLLVHEMFNKRNKSIEIKVGELIPIQNISIRGIGLKSELALLKKHLYRVSKDKEGIFVTQKCICHPENRQTLKEELSKSKLLGTTKDDMKIYLCDYAPDSSVMREIGRLREYTFRKVGEGTGKKRDLDDYDMWYKHLVLWDDSKLELVGAYRIGESNAVMASDLMEGGFYTSSLFDYKESFYPYLSDSIELGRSFVQPKYWGSRALDYLWYGIGAYLKNNPEIKYMFGPVSLSATYPKMARDMIVFFYKKYFGAQEDVVLSKNRYLLSRKENEECEKIFIGKDYNEDFRILKKMIAQFNLTVPTLYKQYSELCEEGGIRFLDFGVDPDFDNCIDGFIIVDIAKIKQAKKERYIYGTID